MKEPPRRLAHLARWLLVALAVGAYIAAKVDFFLLFDADHVAQYLKHHSVFWLIIAAAAILTWPLETLLKAGNDQT